MHLLYHKQTTMNHLSYTVLILFLVLSCTSELPPPKVQKARLTFVSRHQNEVETVQQLEWQLYQNGDTLYHIYWEVKDDSLQLDRPWIQLAYVPVGKKLWVNDIVEGEELELVQTTSEMGYEILEYTFPKSSTGAVAGGFAFVPTWGLLLSRTYEQQRTQSLEIHTHPARTALVSHFGQQLIYQDSNLYLNQSLRLPSTSVKAN